MFAFVRIVYVTIRHDPTRFDTILSPCSGVVDDYYSGGLIDYQSGLFGSIWSIKLDRWLTINLAISYRLVYLT